MVTILKAKSTHSPGCYEVKIDAEFEKSAAEYYKLLFDEIFNFMVMEGSIAYYTLHGKLRAGTVTSINIKKELDGTWCIEHELNDEYWVSNPVFYTASEALKHYQKGDT